MSAIFNLFASLFGYIMSFIYGIVLNYGLAIIVFTVLVKILMLPLTLKQQKALQKSQEIQPLMQELQKKYANDQQKFMEEYQKLLKSKNMNMMSGMGCSGCLISLIQLPILLGVFYMMASPLTHILKLDSTEIEAYKQEVNEIRMNRAIVQIQTENEGKSDAEIEALITEAKNRTYINPRYSEIDIINEKGLMNFDFLGINLGDSAINNKSNYAMLVIPILSTVFTYLSLIMTSVYNKKKGIKTPKPEDSEIPMPDMRVMNIMMPLMTGYIAYSIPQGVGLYWAMSNFLNVVQMGLTKFVFEKPGKNSINNNVLNSNNTSKDNAMDDNTSNYNNKNNNTEGDNSENVIVTNVEYDVIDESSNKNKSNKPKSKSNKNKKKKK